MNKPILLLHNFGVFGLMVLLLFGCNSKEEEPDYERFTIKMVMQGNRPSFIDVNAFFPNSRIIKMNSQQGNFTFAGGKSYVYTPSIENSDKLSLTLELSDKSNIYLDIIVEDNSVSDCNQNTPFTKLTLSKNTYLAINILNNPEFCLLPMGRQSISMSLSGPRTGDVDINSEGIITLLNSTVEPFAMLYYVTPKDFVGTVQSKYYVAVNIKEGFGSDTGYVPASAQFFSAHDFQILVPE